jgi:branched-chain amino acid transport system substrate-binding protein
VSNRRRSSARGAAAALLGLGALALGGCGGTSTVNKIHGRRLTIYASVPLDGASRPDAQAVINGAQLALHAVSGRIGEYQIALEVLNDATPKKGGWDPGQTETDARLAAANGTAIGYIGDLNSGASAVSIPLLNREGIAQISPTSTAVGLTSDGAGSSPGEPEKYYPTRRLTFARVIPNDSIQAAAQVKLQQSLGCTNTYVVNDGEVDGLEEAMTFAAAAKAARLNLLGNQSYEPGAANYTAFAASVASTDPDCVLLSVLTQNSAALVSEALAAALPHAQIFGGAGIAESTYTDPRLGGIPTALDPRILITVATLGGSAYPPAGRGFLAGYAHVFGSPPPYAIFGYEAMSLMLDAIARATDGGHRTAWRSHVVAALFETRDRHSVLGTYSIDANGDTTLNRYGVWRVIGGRLVYWKAITG